VLNHPSNDGFIELIRYLSPGNLPSGVNYWIAATFREAVKGPIANLLVPNSMRGEVSPEITV
jgi:hypothetical protein